MEISIFSLLSFGVFLIYLGLGWYVYKLKPESPVNRIFILLSAVFAIWAFTFTFFYSAPDKQTAWFWYNLSALGRFFYPAVLLHIALVFTKNNFINRKWYHALLIYIPAFIFLYAIATVPFITQDLILINSQWYEVLITNNFWWYAYNSYYLFYDFLGFVIIGWWGYQSSYLREKMQALVIIIAGAVALTLGTLANTVFQALDIFVLPSTAQIFGLIFFLGIGYAIIKYQLLKLTPAVAAELIVSKVTDLVILIDPEGKIIKVNNRAENLLGYTESELKERDWGFLLQDTRELEKARERMDKVLKRSSDYDKSHWTGEDLELTYGTKNGDKIPVKSYLSAIKDKYGIIGVVIVAQDMRQTRELESEIIERKKAQKSAKNHADNLEILNGIIKFVNQSQELATLLREALKSALIISAHSSGGLYLVAENRKTAVLKCWENLNPGYVERFEKLDVQKIPLKELMTSSVFISGDYSKLYPVNPNNLGFVSAGIIPILSQSQIIGFIGLFSRKHEKFTESQIEIMESMGRDVGAAISRIKTEDEIKRSLEEKEVLLKEIHHRVKNNMQIISSLLNLQAGYIQDQEAADALNECQGRIMSMAMIHEKLYQSGTLAGINFADYINGLVSDILYSFTADSGRIKIDVDAADVTLNIDTAVPCGLIINELVTNSIKHAFPDGRNGHIFIHMTQNKEGDYLLVVSDDGIGLPQDLDVSDATTLGLLLVNTLVNQLEGALKIDRNHGTTFRILFKKLEYNQRI